MTKPTTQSRTAMLISHLFDPIPVTLVIGLVGLLETPMDHETRLFWFGLLGVMAAIVGVVLLWFVRLGYVFDAPLSGGADLHRHRLGVLWITDLILIVGVLVAWLIGRPEPLWSVLVGMTVVLVVTTLVTTVYKVSIHAIALTSLVTVLLLLYGQLALPVLLLLPLVGWARLTLERHTVLQLLTGFGLATGLLVATFSVTGQL